MIERDDSKLNIMIVNDDGITSPGLKALARALGEKANVYVCAPDGERSAQSQAITITDTIDCYDFDYPYAVAAMASTGTPTDCTKIGLQMFRDRGIEMDMVYSGINIGSNFGKDTLYSGTIGAAMEAALSGIRAVAVSVDSHSATHFDGACKVAVDVIERSMECLTPDTILNINAPNIPMAEIKGIRYTALGNRFYIDKFIPTDKPGSFMLDGAPVDLNDIEEKYDVTATWDGYISVTPLQFDYTAHDKIEEVAGWGLTLDGSDGSDCADGSDCDGAADADSSADNVGGSGDADAKRMPE